MSWAEGHTGHIGLCDRCAREAAGSCSSDPSCARCCGRHGRGLQLLASRKRLPKSSTMLGLHDRSTSQDEWVMLETLEADAKASP